MIGDKVGTNRRIDARRTLTMFAGIEVTPVHSIHVGRGATKIRDVSFKVGHLCDLPSLAKYAFFRTANNKLSLMGWYGTESTSAKAPAMHIDGEFDHFICGNSFILVFWVGESCVRKVICCINFLSSHRWKHWVLYNINASYWLKDTLGVHSVRLFFYVSKILCVCFFVMLTFFKRV